MTDEIKGVVDINEPFKVIESIEGHPDIDQFETERLPAGDIEILGVGIERKTMSDYVSSLQDGRIEEQSIKLGQRYEEAYILIDGDMSDTSNVYSGMKPESIRGSMCSLTARPDSGVSSVIPCSNTAKLVDVAVRLARKTVEESNRSHLSTGPIDDQQPTAMKMYGCIDGVGPETAKNIYERHPSMKSFVENASQDSLCGIDGIGPTRANDILVSLL